MFQNLFNTYLINAENCTTIENKMTQGEDNKKRYYDSNCEEYDLVKYMHYKQGAYYC